MSTINYATGCAFTIHDMFLNFPYHKLLLTCKESKLINNNSHRDLLIKLVFRTCLKLVINDVVENNITFWLPTLSRKCNIHMRRVRGDDFKHLRRAGKWKDVDFLESNFTGYEIGFYMFGKVSPRIKTIYVNKEYKNRITENTNRGMSYGDSCHDKTISDYYETMFNLYPNISKVDIKRILNYAWKSLYLLNSYGGDTFIKDADIWCYIGHLKFNPLDHFLYYIRKLSVRIRILYRRKKIPWDGYYYFAIHKELYNELFSNKVKVGRKKKKHTFKNVVFYLILEECKIREYSKPYIFRVPYITVINFKFFKLKFTTDKAELIMVRNPLKFKDILITDNEYSVL